MFDMFWNNKYSSIMTIGGAGRIVVGRARWVGSHAPFRASHANGEKSEALTVGAREGRWATRARPSKPRQLLLRRRGPKGASRKTPLKDRREDCRVN
jgi:hypothetical protein